MAPPKIKVYELAKELEIDAQNLVDSAKRLGIDVKNSMGVLGSEEVRTIRDHYRKNRMPSKPTTNSPTLAAKSVVTEKRVGSTVIRRRSAKTAQEPVEEVAKVEEELEPVQEIEAEQLEAATAEAEEQVDETDSQVEVEAAAEEVVSAEEPQKTKEPEQAVAAAAVPEVPKKLGRKLFGSIIKKVSSEKHLEEKIGPKIDRPKREPVTDSKKGVSVAPGSTTGLGVKRGLIKEIDPNIATEAAREANKKRILERQSKVFKSADYLKREMIHSMKKKKAAPTRPAQKTMITKPAEHKRVVEMGANITVASLAKDMGIKASQVVSKLMGMGVQASMNQSIDHDTAALIGQEFGYEIKQQVFREEDFVPTLDVKPEEMKSRAPVVTIMGHVDHGKTSLLDYIRKAKVAAGEAGGITQHVGAYTVKLPKGEIAFIDTPGHEAFTAMRARGAKVTDIVVLVVSAADGVMPQTLESAAHAKAAGVPIIVAVNKIDLPDANPDRIKQTLAGHDLNPEEWGGDTLYVSVSAKTGQGVDQLLDAILLQAEMRELKAAYDVPARGTVIECRLDKASGPLAAVLIQHGKLETGAIVVVGTVFGKVRAMTDSFGNRLKEAGPSTPVEVLGLPGVPNVGDELVVMPDEASAKELAEQRAEVARLKAIEARAPKLTLDELLNAPSGDKELRIILKADVQGSSEALAGALAKFPTDRVRLKLLHTGTGGISESDVMLANASRAVIMGFNIRPDVKALKLAENEGIEVRTYSIIYDLLEDVKRLLEGLLDSTVKEMVIGRAEVREVFTVPKVGTVAGSAVIDGKVQRGCFLRLLRDSRIIYEGKISSLRRFKEDVKEVTSGFECGIGLEKFTDIKLGDQFEAFLKEEIKGSL